MLTLADVEQLLHTCVSKATQYKKNVRGVVTRLLPSCGEFKYSLRANVTLLSVGLPAAARSDVVRAGNLWRRMGRTGSLRRGSSGTGKSGTANVVFPVMLSACGAIGTLLVCWNRAHATAPGRGVKKDSRTVNDDCVVEPGCRRG